MRAGYLIVMLLFASSCGNLSGYAPDKEPVKRSKGMLIGKDSTRFIEVFGGKYRKEYSPDSVLFLVWKDLAVKAEIGDYGTIADYFFTDADEQAGREDCPKLVFNNTGMTCDGKPFAFGQTIAEWVNALGQYSRNDGKRYIWDYIGIIAWEADDGTMESINIHFSDGSRLFADYKSSRSEELEHRKEYVARTPKSYFGCELTLYNTEVGIRTNFRDKRDRNKLSWRAPHGHLPWEVSGPASYFHADDEINGVYIDYTAWMSPHKTNRLSSLTIMLDKEY